MGRKGLRPARAAERRRLKRIGGWLPDCPPLRTVFELQARRREITMLKPLDADVRFDTLQLAAGQHFREIDHV